MTENVPMKVMNFNQTDFTVIYDIKIYCKSTSEWISPVSMEKKLRYKYVSPYMVLMNRYAEFANMLYMFSSKLPERFVQMRKETVVDTPVYTVYMYYFNVKQSFLPYLKQSDGWQNEFMKQKLRIERLYYVHDKNFIDFMNILKNDKRTLIDNEYSLNCSYKEVNGEKFRLSLVVENGQIYRSHDNKQLHLHYDYNKQMYYLALHHLERYNYYDKFLKLMEEFFRTVNVSNNDDWDEYIDFEVAKMVKYLGDDELKRLQDEYNSKYDNM